MSKSVLDYDAIAKATADRMRRIAEAQNAYALMQSSVPWEHLPERIRTGFMKIVDYFQRNHLPCPDCGGRVCCEECGSPLKPKGAKP